MLKILASAMLLFSAAASAQVTSYKSQIAAPIRGDAHKIVCLKEETLGTRLGARKVCLTVAEWEARSKDGRDQTERVQSGTRVCANPPCPGGG